MKKIFKAMIIVVAAIFAMILYTNAFPIEVKAGTKWEEVGRDLSRGLTSDEAAELSREYPERWCYNYDTDQFWINRTRTIYWKGFEVDFIYT